MKTHKKVNFYSLYKKTQIYINVKGRTIANFAPEFCGI